MKQARFGGLVFMPDILHNQTICAIIKLIVAKSAIKYEIIGEQVMKKRILSVFLAAAMLLTNVTDIISSAETANTTQSTNETDDTSSSLSVTPINSFGSMLASDMDNTSAMQSMESGYAITNLVMDGNTAAVALVAKEDCTLIVSIYTEDGTEMIASESSEISCEDTAVGLIFDAELPEYYIAKAFLVDTYDGHSLCHEYENIEQTQAKQEFNALTVNDFDEELVINFDDDETNNFAVLREGVIVIEDSKAYNNVKTVDEENKVYVIENADDTFKSLKVGETFSFRYATIGHIVGKVKEIHVEGDTVTIFGDELEMNEAFEVVKINVAANPQDVVFYEDGQKIKEQLLSEDYIPVVSEDKNAHSSNGDDAIIEEKDISISAYVTWEGELETDGKNTDGDIDFDCGAKIEYNDSTLGGSLDTGAVNYEKEFDNLGTFKVQRSVMT